jgi:hypothetical protein
MGLRGSLAALALLGLLAAKSALPHEPAAGRDEAFVPDPVAAQLASAGFKALLADYYWLKAVQIVGSQEGPVGRSRQVGALLDVVTHLDPWVDHPYRFAAVWMTDDEAAVRKANELIERGIAHHPDDWRNYFHLGFNNFFYLGDEVAAARALEPAVELEGAPVYLRRLVARLKSQSGGLEVAAAFLQELAAQAPDEFARAEYLKGLDEIEVDRRARLLDRARVEFFRRQGRDIERVEDLLEVHPPVLSELPPEPHGWEWKLDEASGQIVSTYVGYRYRVKIDQTNRELLRRFRERSHESEES